MRMWNLKVGPLAVTAALAVSACGGDEPPESRPVAEIGPGDTTEVRTDGDVDAQAELLGPDDATRDALLAIEGVDETTADALIAGRPYDDMLQVDDVLSRTLVQAQREEVYRHLWMPIDLNEASREEILLIPGVGERMAHEFEEYRPYDGIARFEREIGKYVDDDEVARLARYVEVR